MRAAAPTRTVAAPIPTTLRDAEPRRLDLATSSTVRAGGRTQVDSVRDSFFCVSDIVSEPCRRTRGRHKRNGPAGGIAVRVDVDRLDRRGAERLPARCGAPLPRMHRCERAHERRA